MNKHFHSNKKVLVSGEELGQSGIVLVLLHGRGSTAEDILSLSQSIQIAGVTYIAPQAEGHSWYPHSFVAPWEDNEPYVSSALLAVRDVITSLHEQSIDAARIVLAGFSQGACLACEYVARNPEHIAAAAVFTGGLIGEVIRNQDHIGVFANTPIYLSTGSHDPHVPLERVQETAKRFEARGADVKIDIFPDRPHTITPAEIDALKSMLEDLLATRSDSA